MRLLPEPAVAVERGSAPRQPSPAPEPAWAEAAPRALGLACAALGFSGLLGWTLNVPILTSLWPAWQPIRPNAAAAALLSGLALRVLCGARPSPRAVRAARAAAGVVLAIGALTLAEFVLGADLRIDVGGRISFVAALNCALLGSALLMLDRDGGRRRGPTQALALGAGFMTLLTVLSYLYGIRQIHLFNKGVDISLTAALAFLLSACGIVAARRDAGPVAALLSAGAGGRFFRQLLPFGVAGPLVLGLVSVEATRSGLISEEANDALTFGGVIALACWALYRLALLADKTEAEARRSEAARRANFYNRSLLEASLDPLVVIGPGGRITDANGAAESATGWSRSVLIGADFSDFFAKPALARAGYEQAFRDGSVRDYPLDVLHKDGAVTPVLYNATVVRDETGRTIGVLAAARDVSERKRAEASLRRASAYNRRLLEASLDPLVNIGRDGRINDVNAATERLTGRGRTELIGTDFADYFTDRDAARAGYLKAYRDGFVVDYPLDARAADGRVTPVLYNASVFRDEDGEVAGVFAAARDVSERKRAEAELKRATQEALRAEQEVRRLNAELEDRVKQRTTLLEKANAELESFAYSVSHDLRAPLRAIDGFSQMLVEDHGPKLDDECRRLIGTVRESVGEMAALIDDLLAFSRMSRQELLRRETDMRRVVDAALETLAAQREGRNVRLAIGACVGDPAMLKQVWVNLIGNALKFTRARPEAVIEIGSEDQGGQTVYWIKDNGVGFDMRFVDKLFKVFQRLHRGTEYEGTGIGLAIVARIVERHGGRVWAEGEPDKGARFSFILGGT